VGTVRFERLSVSAAVTGTPVPSWQRGWSRAEKKVIIADGAVWIWNLADREFPGAIQIVDLYHVREHIWVLAGKLFSTEDRQRKRWAAALQKKLDAGKSSRASDNYVPFRSCTEAAELLRIEADYFQHNQETYALPCLPPPEPLRRLRRHRGGLQNRHRQTTKTIRDVLDGPRRQRDHRSSLLPLNRNFEDYWASRAIAA
jgi:hypothetical protein